MTLRLYLDDCANAGKLRAMLQAAGHTVVIPAEVGLAGQEDHVHFLHASENHLVLVTKNPRDFIQLHQANPQHAGIVVIYQDNDVTRDLTNEEVVRALGLLEQAYQSVGLANAVHVLNPWRTASSATGLSSTTPKKGKKGRPKK